jgi:hypothetical protein
LCGWTAPSILVAVAQAIKTAKKKRASKDQVRAWLHTVIAPMLGALSVESEHAGRNWSFRAGRKDFEFLWTADMMIGEYYRAVREQLFRYHPELAELTRRHDVTREELRRACERAFQRVMESPQFRQLASERPDDDRRYLAEYLVNGLRELPGNYTLSDYWKTKGPGYLQLADPALGESWLEIERSGDKARKAIAALRARLEHLQAELADEFGLPPVDPSGAAAV